MFFKTLNTFQLYQVVIRVRPPLPRELSREIPFQNTIAIDREQVITVSENIEDVMGEDGQLLTNPGPYTTHTFMFDHVYDPGATQKNVYENTARTVVDSALQGYNATIFAYGQTGTGKTFTMEGFTRDGNVEARGIIPRAIEQIFGHIQMNGGPKRQFLVRASYLQIYNEQISDLLKPERSNLTIREDKRRGVFVDGLSEWVVRSPAEIYGLMERGGMERATGETKMNKVSSRSHAVFIVIAEQSETVYIDEQGNEMSPDALQEMLHTRGVRSDKDMHKIEDHKKQIFKVGKLNLVDLAGSERVRLSGAIGQRLEESKQINRSLSALGNVISALTDSKGRQHIPYRDSKLTRMLEDSLGGNCKTTMMAMISPALEAMVETISTLKFANRAKNIRNEARVNEDLDQKSLLRKYEKELKQLRAELESRSKNVVDKRKLLELDDMRRRAEADKMAAIRALEARSLEFMREKEEKKNLEMRISSLMSQMIRGGVASDGDGANAEAQMSTGASNLLQLYEGKLASLERERESIEEEKAQVDRYKQLLLKQRDIMIALTQRLVERDEQIMGLQDELDAYDRHIKELEEKLDEKTAMLIKFQRISMEVNAASPNKNQELSEVLNQWNNSEGRHGGEATELDATYQQFEERVSSGAYPKGESDMITSSLGKIQFTPEESSELDSGLVSTLTEENSRLLDRVRQLESQALSSNPSESERVWASRCEILVKERTAVHTIMEQKINVLVQNVSKSVSAVLQNNPSSGSSSAGVALAKDVAALQRLVNASITALKNAASASASNVPSAPSSYVAGSPKSSSGVRGTIPLRSVPPVPSMSNGVR